MSRLIWRVLLCVLLSAAAASPLVGCGSRGIVKDPVYTGLNAASFQRIIEDLCDPQMQGRDAGTEGIDLARDYLVERFERAGLEPGFVIDGKPSYVQPFEIRVGLDADQKVINATIENVGAVLPGVGELADEVVVIGGHYDHVGFGDIGSRDKSRKGEIHVGADDNASGTAGVVLLARYFALMDQADPDTPRRTILFTGFAGEERGLLGSRYMTKHPEQWPFELGQVVGMINMDMVGRLRGDELYVFTDQTGKQWRDWTEQANEPVGLKLQWDVRPPGGSDHTLFINVGVPAVFFNTWLHPDYHTPDDTPDKINAAGGEKILEMVANLLNKAATEPERLVFVEPVPMPRPFLGAELVEPAKGQLVKSLADDGPMQKAGVKPGDLLTAIDGNPITSRSDLRMHLLKAKPGQVVVLSLIRDNKEIEIKVELGNR